MKCARRVVCFSDSAFKNEGNDGRAMKGAIALRLATSSAGRAVCHLLEANRNSQKHVVLSTFGAELRDAVHVADKAALHRQTLEEVTFGPMTPTIARDQLERVTWK